MNQANYEKMKKVQKKYEDFQARAVAETMQLSEQGKLTPEKKKENDFKVGLFGEVWMDIKKLIEEMEISERRY